MPANTPSSPRAPSAARTSATAHTSCGVCGKSVSPDLAVPLETLVPGIQELIRKERPDIAANAVICPADLKHFRSRHIARLLEAETGELGELENIVLRSIEDRQLLSVNLHDADETPTLGQRLADRLTTFGGSWRFIIIFTVVLAVWIALNVTQALITPFDPFPFILLNLALSCLAAIQAPIIMMSQNRQETKDRMHAEHDYLINLKAELEIRRLNEKMDHLILRQWRRLLEIQRLQMQVLEEVLDREDRRGGGNAPEGDADGKGEADGRDGKETRDKEGGEHR